jgi:hypothetical protein
MSFAVLAVIASSISFQAVRAYKDQQKKSILNKMGQDKKSGKDCQGAGQTWKSHH